MIATNDEMKKGSEPDESADYWEERKFIASHLVDLKTHKGTLTGLDKEHKTLDKKTLETLAAL